MAAGQRVWISMFCTVGEATRAYDTAAWRFSHARSELNFPDIESVEEA
jgi:hypothetical protein